MVECAAYAVWASPGLDTSGSSISYTTGWSKGDEVERYADLIDRLARRLFSVKSDCLSEDRRWTERRLI